MLPIVPHNRCSFVDDDDDGNDDELDGGASICFHSMKGRGRNFCGVVNN